MRLESEPYKKQSFLAVISDASVAYFLENQRHINAGQRRQDVLTVCVMRMTIKGLFCCLWAPLRCLQSWLRVQAFSPGHVTHACFPPPILLSYIIVVSVLGCVIVTFWVLISCSLVGALEKLSASIFRMKIASSCEMLVTAYQTTWHHITIFSVYIHNSGDQKSCESNSLVLLSLYYFYFVLPQTLDVCRHIIFLLYCFVGIKTSCFLMGRFNQCIFQCYFCTV
jgi:hypothetical protein